MGARTVRSATLLGCGAVFGLLVAIPLVDAGRRYPYVVAGALAFLLVVELLITRQRRRAVARFRAAYAGAGKDLLIVYTDSPHRGPYIEERWLPRWESRAVVLNRSRPWRADSPEAQLWHAVAGSEEHTPLAVVVPRRGRITVVRFWRAFRDHKHGRPRRLEDAESRLAAALDASAR